jgi:hypothetical protein
MEPSNEQYLIINVLDSLELLLGNIYNENTGTWYIRTPSPILPTAVIMRNGEVYPVDWIQGYDNEQ